MGTWFRPFVGDWMRSECEFAVYCKKWAEFCSFPIILSWIGFSVSIITLVENVLTLLTVYNNLKII